MDAMPTLASFAERYDAGASQVVWTRLVADLETPVSAYLKLAADKPMCFLFELVEGGAARGRYSVIGLEPDLVWRAAGDKASVNRPPVAKPDAFKPEPLPTLASLRAFLAESQIDLPAELPPMAAGIFGYMGYDTVRLMERLPDVPADALHIPDGLLMRPTAMAIFDIIKDEITIVTPVRPDAGILRRESLQGGVQAPQGHRRGARPAAAALALGHRPQDCRAQADVEHDAGRIHGHGAQRQGVHRRWRHLPGGASRSAFPRRSRCRRSRSTAPCGAPTPRRSSSTSTSATSPSSAPARRSSCACARAR